MPVEIVVGSSVNPEVSVIVPTLDRMRNGNVPSLISQLCDQENVTLEVILSVGESPNGYARNIGAAAASGRYLVFIDDDVILKSTDTINRLIEPFKSEGSIGLTGISQLLPPDANSFQQRCGRELPRTVSPIVDRLTDSDMVTTMCLAITRDLFEQIGGMNDWIIAGVDPDLRHRVRQIGRRVVVIPHAWAYHPAPGNWTSLYNYAFKKGRFTAWQYRFARQLMYDCPEGHQEGFTEQSTLPYRVCRKAVQTALKLITGRYFGVVYEAVYAMGYVRGLTCKWDYTGPNRENKITNGN